jgi:hypothetical protein
VDGAGSRRGRCCTPSLLVAHAPLSPGLPPHLPTPPARPGQVQPRQRRGRAGSLPRACRRPAWPLGVRGGRRLCAAQRAHGPGGHQLLHQVGTSYYIRHGAALAGGGGGGVEAGVRDRLCTRRSRAEPAVPRPPPSPRARAAAPRSPRAGPATTRGWTSSPWGS